MKMTPEHFKKLSSIVDDFIAVKTPEHLVNYCNSIAGDERIHDLETRFVWDIYWAIPRTLRSVWYEDAKLYNDNHMTTALKKAVKTSMGELYPFTKKA